ncbi:rhodanese-like domain-containing protein [Niallia taxi]|uniref:Rhodanese-like domain-containing protein n=1 Tax=Niallia taxi TaxID=2499688 RepID=A0A3S2W444_9BACI|nr:rhodanese-like domain-containing protein [Niallia taxi]RVT62614.1 rhodanese-like domain-containing protein [Niallia taxi]
MTYINYLLLAFLLFFVVKRLLPIKDVKNITTTELKRDLTKMNKQFIDVRTTGEFKGNHIRGFKNIPLDQLAQKAERELTKEKEVIVICQSGMRSKRACKMLTELGFRNVKNVKGGMRAWF